MKRVICPKRGMGAWMARALASIEETRLARGSFACGPLPREVAEVYTRLSGPRRWLAFDAAGMGLAFGEHAPAPYRFPTSVPRPFAFARDWWRFGWMP